MKPVECEFESEVLAAVLQARWPDHVDAELHAHVAECGICSDVAAIAGAIDDAGRVWWLARMRAHREAVEAAGGPITAVQAIACGCGIALLGACFGATSTWFQSVLQRVTSGEFLVYATALVAAHGALVLTMAALVFLVPAVVCLAVLRD
jgi:hypothetical protein